MLGEGRNSWAGMADERQGKAPVEQVTATNAVLGLDRGHMGIALQAVALMLLLWGAAAVLVRSFVRLRARVAWSRPSESFARARERVRVPRPSGTFAGPARRIRAAMPSVLRGVASGTVTLGLLALVVVVGVTGAGALDLPHEAATVAWFQHGAAPGESGSAVLAGHVDYDGDPGALFDLRDMPRGARIDVHFNDGTIRTFVTHATAVSYPKSSLPLDVLFRRGESPVLTLVTCGGTFDRRTRSYADNVTVVAVPARSAPS